MTLLLEIVAPLFLLAPLPPAAIAQLRHWTHPGRVVLEACSAGVLLILGPLALPYTGWLAIAWWAVLLLCAVAAGVALWRVSARPAPHLEGLTGRAAVSAQPPGRRTVLWNAAVWLVVALAALVGG